MSTKQVKSTALTVVPAVAVQEQPAPAQQKAQSPAIVGEVLANLPKTAEAPQKALYVKITTLGERSVLVGSRIVDMYHFGTRNWIHNHLWWATHNGHLVETELATDEEVNEYLANATKKLAEKFAH